MNRSPQNLDTALPDPADWNPTRVPALSTLDASLRCEICKDFYNAPVITSCGHTFCSLCIRRCLGADGKCATCRTVEQESRLRKNGAVAQAVEAFLGVREKLLEIVAQPEEPEGEEDAEEDGQAETAEEEMEVEEIFPQSQQRRSGRLEGKRRGYAVADDAYDDEPEDSEDDGYSLPQSQGRRSTGTNRKRAVAQESAEARQQGMAQFYRQTVGLSV